ncbi:MAG TPA: hypothetical protein VL866_24180 [Pyrinomonadaceae bacterium]|nr:hypothetical protein [Pyrinomonadaceae bacterium]
MRTIAQYELWERALAEMTDEQRAEIESMIANARSVEFVFNCPKVKYGHRETAETAAEAMHAKTGDSYDAYQCDFCGSWHIGHSKG